MYALTLLTASQRVHIVPSLSKEVTRSPRANGRTTPDCWRREVPRERKYSIVKEIEKSTKERGREQGEKDPDK